MSNRSTRLARIIHQHIARIVPSRLSDPRLRDDVILTISEVKLSTDCRNARVFVSIYAVDEARIPRILLSLERATGYINRELVKEIDIKYIPKLKFILDDTASVASRIMESLGQVPGSENG